jgi:predicted metal-dependent peptidase
MIDKKISQVKAKLLVDYPLFGTIASKLELIADDDLKTFKSDGISLHYNSEYFEELSNEEMEFVFANGAMHASLSHEMRKNNRSGWLWHLATDYAINDMLVENGLEYPDYVNYSKRFSGMYAEEIYAELKEDILRDELEYEADDEDDVQNDNAQNNQTQINTEEQLFEEFVKSVLLDEADKDSLPVDIERFFTYINSAKVDWRDELRSAIERFHKDDYTQMPPNKKFLHMGLYLPSNTSNTFRLAVAVDSSGSIDEKLLSTFLSELNFLMNVISSYKIELLVCDEKIHLHKTFYTGDILEVDVIKGGGYTDFRPVFDYVDKNFDDLNLLLYFTDLDGVFPKYGPRYNVKWITTEDKEIPFGEIIKL